MADETQKTPRYNGIPKMAPTHFCLGTFTAESLKNNFGLNSGVKFLRFRFAIGYSIQVDGYYTIILSLKSAPNFWWQYRFTFNDS